MVAATVSSKLLLRCDANESIGIGHAIRCLALAEAARSQNIGVIVAYEGIPAIILAAFVEIGAELEPLDGHVDRQAQAHTCLSHFPCEDSGWIFLDLREIGEGQINALSGGPARLALLDDGAHRYFNGVDLIINPNIEATAKYYASKISATTSLALGLKYLPLRKKFCKTERQHTIENQLCAVLITMGGADPDNLSLPLGIAFDRLTQKAEIELLVGPSFSEPIDLIRRLTKGAPSVRVLTAFQDMAALLSRKEIVVTLAGTSLWEAAACGACLVGIARDELQRATLVAGNERELFAGTFDLRDFSAEAVAKAVEGLIDTPALRRSYMKRSSEIVDGGGALRVIDLMHELSLRRAS
jgi:spore coat polysaccharide biosynthesis predicted glycosyltransferase SpsG